MSEKTNWETKAANIVKAELKRRGVTYAQLIEKLAEIGVEEKEANLKNKLSRGTFSAAYFLACMAAIEVTNVRLDN